MQCTTLYTLFLLFARLCQGQDFPSYIQFQGNSSGPTRGLPSNGLVALQRADNSQNASHTVSLSSPGNADWDWTLQISDVSLPSNSNSTPDAHVAFTTYHLSRPGAGSGSSKRAESSPVCAYLYDLDFPSEVTSQWEPDFSSCTSALGIECTSYLAGVYVTDNCDGGNAPSFLTADACAGMLRTDGIVTQGLAFNADNVMNGTWAYALSRPYEAGNATASRTAEERLRIMVLSGPEGSDAFCNRVARTVDSGNEGKPDTGKSDDGDEQDAGSSTSVTQGNDSNSGSDQDSHASSSDDEDSPSVVATYIPGFGTVLLGVVACSLATSYH